MGAFSFAADTIASLSAAFASKQSSPLVQVNLNNLNLELDENAHRIFREFSTGMKMLFTHGRRNPCNVSHISQQNLKLLHTNLKANPSYQCSLERIKQNSSATDNWAWLPMLSNEQISAGMLFLPTNGSISPNKSGFNLTIHQDELQAPFANNLDYGQVNQLYLSVEGCTGMNISYDNSNSDLLLKHGEGFTTQHATTIVNRISALQGHSLVLSIQLPAVQ